jgi:hypothetical protein
MSNNFRVSPPADGQRAFVPAAPGWYAIEPVYEDEGTPIYELVRCPIVAWKSRPTPAATAPHSNRRTRSRSSYCVIPNASKRPTGAFIFSRSLPSPARRR